MELMKVILTMGGAGMGNLNIEDEWDVLSKINKSRRKKLMKFLKEHQGEEARIIPAVPRDDIPKSNKEDRGTMAFFFVSRNVYYKDRMDFFTLVDILDADKKETLIKLYKPKGTMLEFLGQEEAVPSYDPAKQYVIDREKVGRPRRVLSDSEKLKIRQLRCQGKGYNAIAKEMRISNRRVINECRRQDGHDESTLHLGEEDS